jgi:hypothetical protein
MEDEAKISSASAHVNVSAQFRIKRCLGVPIELRTYSIRKVDTEPVTPVDMTNVTFPPPKLLKFNNKTKIMKVLEWQFGEPSYIKLKTRFQEPIDTDMSIKYPDFVDNFMGLDFPFKFQMHEVNEARSSLIRKIEISCLRYMSKGSVYDAGCGDLPYLQQYRRFGDVYCSDISLDRSRRLIHRLNLKYVPGRNTFAENGILYSMTDMIYQLPVKNFVSFSAVHHIFNLSYNVEALLELARTRLDVIILSCITSEISTTKAEFIELSDYEGKAHVETRQRRLVKTLSGLVYKEPNYTVQMFQTLISRLESTGFSCVATTRSMTKMFKVDPSLLAGYEIAVLLKRQDPWNKL